MFLQDYDAGADRLLFHGSLFLLGSTATVGSNDHNKFKNIESA